MFRPHSPQQHWQSKSLQQKFLAYEKAYSRTGYIGFPALNLVAFMALKGTVFTPDKTEKTIKTIQAATTQINHFVDQIQAEFDAIARYPTYLQNRLQTPLRELDQAIISLIQTINQEVLTITGMLSTEHDTVKHHLSELSYARTYLLERLTSDLETTQGGHYHNLQRAEKYLTTIHASTHELASMSTRFIEQRVPFYHIG